MVKFCLVQVECKKAQPKEVMLPVNIAKGKTTTRGLGELVMVGPGSGLLPALRYSPYSVPSTNTATMVALSQPMSFTSPAPTSVPISVSGAGSAMAPPSGMSHQLQLFGQFDAAAAAQQANQASQMASINQLLASQLGLAAGKAGSLSYPSHMQAAPAGPGQTPGFGQLGLGYNVSDLLNLQGLQGLHGALQVPVGL